MNVPEGREIRSEDGRVLFLDGDEGAAIPIITDPWLGNNLWKKITVDTYKRQARVNVELSPRGWTAWSGAAIAGDGEWNLAKFRPNQTKHWSYEVAKHHCNWKTANRF